MNFFKIEENLNENNNEFDQHSEYNFITPKYIK